MNRRTLLSAALLLASGGLMAAEFNPRAHDDLTPVIMLCATAPDSPRFDAAWMDWVRANPDADLTGAIRTVLSGAGTVRSMAIPGMRPVPDGARPDPAALEERMRYLARKARA